jgi:hypothetical protein
MHGMSLMSIESGAIFHVVLGMIHRAMLGVVILFLSRVLGRVLHVLLFVFVHGYLSSLRNGSGLGSIIIQRMLKTIL